MPPRPVTPRQRPATRTLPRPVRPSPRTLAQLPREVLQLHLNSRNLSVQGSRHQLIARLRRAYRRPQRGDHGESGMETTPPQLPSRGESPSPVRRTPPRTTTRGRSPPAANATAQHRGSSSSSSPGSPNEDHHRLSSQRRRRRGNSSSDSQRSQLHSSQRRRHSSADVTRQRSQRSRPQTSQRRHSSVSSDSITHSRNRRLPQRPSQRRARSPSLASSNASASDHDHSTGHTLHAQRHSSRHSRGRSYERHPRSRKRPRYLSSSSSTSPSSSSSGSSSASSSRHRSRRRHRHCTRHRHRRHRHHRPSGLSSSSTVSCAPPVPSRIRRKIHRGEYVDFEKLLLPTRTPPLFQPLTKQKRNHKEAKRVLTDLASWLEAWNRFLCCHLTSFPLTALEMVKYQTLVIMLFANHPPQHCLEYDRLFRQSAAQDTSLRWDTIKEDIYVWAITKKGQSFRDKPSIMSRLGPPPDTANSRVPTKPGNRETHDKSGKEICKRYNLGRCTLGDQCVFSHTCWQPGCHGEHPARGCPKQAP